MHYGIANQKGDDKDVSGCAACTAEWPTRKAMTKVIQNSATCTAEWPIRKAKTTIIPDRVKPALRNG